MKPAPAARRPPGSPGRRRAVLPCLPPEPTPGAFGCQGCRHPPMGSPHVPQGRPRRSCFTNSILWGTGPLRKRTTGGQTSSLGSFFTQLSQLSPLPQLSANCPCPSPPPTTAASPSQLSFRPPHYGPSPRSSQITPAFFSSSPLPRHTPHGADPLLPRPTAGPLQLRSCPAWPAQTRACTRRHGNPGPGGASGSGAGPQSGRPRRRRSEDLLRGPARLEASLLELRASGLGARGAPESGRLEGAWGEDRAQRTGKQ